MLFFLVLAPRGAGDKLIRVAIDAECHAKRRRQVGLGQWNVGVRFSVVGRVATASGQFVGNERRFVILISVIVSGFARSRSGSAGGATGSQDADEVAIPDRAFGEFLGLAGSGAKQVADYHRFEVSSELVLRRN
jgi:hypothetical protein